ncbi:MAG TPA: hypothetical protein DFK21_17985 [Salmonella bongori]|uniref:Uncharacterized protein n=2 Tax=Salmonella bongori TaxID=54736 RepID=A0A248KC71_SALBN|nr:hypothetical protein N643_02105 [Salmonella bongori serovar 48:z41:-- str. RKS3044]ASG55647.1 hypothetical protein LFZ56_16075 [Salmonella bongori serovar 66:z41:- str. SA19983605]ECC8731759.1 hypothetical protein [Salmonella bongori]HAC6695000.1 hypothetical protein [Salmonella bongori serovar 44:r:-]ECC9751325.1 hypothetical protein [Salmonella bongori]
MHSVSFGCWGPKFRLIVYDNFNHDVYKKWLSFIKKWNLALKRARIGKQAKKGHAKRDSIGK